MKKVLVIQHVAHEGLGSIYKHLVAKNLRPEYIKLYKGDTLPADTNDYEAIIIMGGPMGVYEEEKFPYITRELKLIKDALDNAKPMLGICLGAQLMVRALGGVVYQGDTKEIGWFDLSLTEQGLKDPLLNGLPERFKVFQWHGDTFDLPSGTELLAESERFNHQLLRIGSNAYALQFHLEVKEVMIREWLDKGRSELKNLNGLIDPQVIIKETPNLIGPLAAYGDTFFSNFFNMIEN